MKKLLILMMLISGFSFAKEGGNGGDYFGAYFSKVASLGLKHIIQKYPGSLSVAEIKKVKELIATAKVSLTNTRICYDVEDQSCSPIEAIIAKNYPDSLRIKVNPIKFFQQNNRVRYMISLHEYLGLAGIENSGTPISILAQGFADREFDEWVSISWELKITTEEVATALNISKENSMAIITKQSEICNSMGYKEPKALNYRSTDIITRDENVHISTIREIKFSRIDGTAYYEDYESSYNDNWRYDTRHITSQSWECVTYLYYPKNW